MDLLTAKKEKVEKDVVEKQGVGFGRGSWGGIWIFVIFVIFILLIIGIG